MRVVALVVVAFGCGRIGFDPAGGQSGGDGGNRPPACVSDGFCAPGCGAADPDCQTACGDGICVGNAGELCTTCAADCRTTANVCGNGTCGPGEDGTTCYSDCGPAPWTWAQDELDLLTAINQARTGGTSCGGMAATTAPALTMDPTLHAAARDAVWEQAHLAAFSLTRCDGQSFFTWLSSTGASNGSITTSQTTNAQRIATLLGSSTSCMTTMDPSFTAAGIGIAVDMDSMLALLYK